MIVTAYLFPKFLLDEIHTIKVCYFDKLKKLAKIFRIRLSEDVRRISLLLKPMYQIAKLASIHIFEKDSLLISSLLSLLLDNLICFLS